MSMIQWPRIRQVKDVVVEMMRVEEAIWITSPSLQHQYPVLAKRSCFLVDSADWDTLVALQEWVYQNRSKWIIAFGGGKVLDLAKLAVRLGRLDEAGKAQLRKRKWITYNESHPYRLTAIPSTAGSGSEVSETAVLTIDGQKVPLHHASLLPNEVLLDEQIVATAPDRVLWNGIWDVFTHALESYVSPLATPASKRLSLDAIRNCKEHVDKLTSTRLEPAPESKQSASSDLQWNSVLAGKAQSVASAGLIHALAHQVEHRKQWHGEACGRIIASVTRFHMTKAEEKFHSIWQACGFEDAIEGIAWLEEKTKQTVGTFRPVDQMQMNREEMLKRIQLDPCFRTNAAYISRQELDTWLQTWWFTGEDQI
ncbi:iron-containing alcohol dehydrogenase [Marinicrinis sediminis]|uniref:Iron-containing alcohol dehydrogenase n=1 Tax=Marinicrinis sediminis TaxID=1652465 RepID=A0ABW5RD26_9BACL